jgi:hypothetical protein
MRVKSLGANQTEIITDNYIILVSYETPVAYFDRVNDKVYRTSKKWSVTTSRHINKWLEDFLGVAEETSQNVLDHLMNNV